MLVTGRDLIAGPRSAHLCALAKVITAAVTGGVTMVQLRENDLPPDRLAELAAVLKDRLPERTPLVVNGPPDILGNGALARAVDGVHIPERYRWPGRQASTGSAVIGQSIHSVEAARRAQNDGVSYVAAGPIFKTPTHPGAEGQGLSFLESVCRAVQIPVLAIGGIGPEHARLCLDAGAQGVAVRSPLMSALNPKEVAAQYRKELGGGEARG